MSSATGDYTHYPVNESIRAYHFFYYRVICRIGFLNRKPLSTI